MRYRKPSYKTLGVPEFLNQTVHIHNGFDGREFLRMMKAKQNPAAVARQAGVSWTQASNWINWHTLQETKHIATE